MRALVGFLGLALLAANAHAQSPTVPVSGDWVERAPISSQQELNCANWSDAEWSVSLQGGVLDAQPVERAQQTGTTRIQFADGALVGRDSGEWGGQLIWQPTDGTPIQLIDDNTRHIFRWNDRVFAAGGLAHLTLSDGYVAELVRTNAGWTVARRTDLSGPVDAVDYSRAEEVVLATPDGVHTMDTSGRVRRIFTSTNWWAQYPNSVLRLANGDILVGMRYSISRLRLSSDGYVETLLVPADCRHLTRNSPTRPCTCSR